MPPIDTMIGLTSRVSIISRQMRSLAKGEPPNSEMHPMRVLFHIPKNNPPQLTGNYSKMFKEFTDACLNKDPSNVINYN